MVHNPRPHEPLLQRWPWLRGLIRAGYVIRGLTYFQVGSLAYLAAGGEGEAENTPGALIRLLSAPAGRLMLLAMATGLIAFGVWRSGQALGIEVPAHKHHWLDRLAYGASAFVYFILGVTAVSPLFGRKVASGEEQTVLWTDWLMNKPLGIWLVGIAGLIVFGVGLYWCISAFAEDPMPSLHLTEEHRLWARPLCWWGLMSWGATLITAGSMFLLAAINHDPAAAGGFEGALATLQYEPFGPWLLTVLAIGLAAFGGFSILEGLWRRLDGRERLFD